MKKEEKKVFVGVRIFGEPMKVCVATTKLGLSKAIGEWASYGMVRSAFKFGDGKEGGLGWSGVRGIGAETWRLYCVRLWKVGGERGLPGKVKVKKADGSMGFRGYKGNDGMLKEEI